jgi:REP element-mobilizing transposase RayT
MSKQIIDLYKVMNVTHYAEEHTTQLTLDEAEELVKDLEEMFPDEQYEIHSDEYVKTKELKHYNNNAVDGWEDMFPYYE